MRITVYVILFCCALLSPFAHAIETADEALGGFIIGTYRVVGVHPDTDYAYQGKAVITEKNNEIHISVSFGKLLLVKKGKIIKSRVEGNRILSLEFEYDKTRQYKQSCLISSDLDNYARLTCYIFNSETKKPGLEAFFIDLNRPN